jgi:antitoxin component YwqK of YwqJK toxin-antitoxin module
MNENADNEGGDGLLWKRYRASGKPCDVGKYRAGKKTGVWKYYDNRGKLSRTRTY